MFQTNAIPLSIQACVDKINVNTENQVACTNAIREALAANGELFDPCKNLTAARNAMKAVIQEKIRLFGSNNQA
ncbi:class II fructose-bisphosphate aldolase [Paenibacillus sp. sgz302251]|uniref:class II fructose-bisphosphate aldolase n=1 Tax=Paenibacillus sp. sgz302251 TaxID=3414493 RepID=UPI003C7D7DE3